MRLLGQLAQQQEEVRGQEVVLGCPQLASKAVIAAWDLGQEEA